MLYNPTLLDRAARQHARYYLKRLAVLQDKYTTTPEITILQLRKIMPQVQQAHSWLLTYRDMNPSHVDLLVEMTLAGMGCVRMVVSSGEWERWLEIGEDAAKEAERPVDRLNLIAEQGIHAYRQGNLDGAYELAGIGEEEATLLDEIGERAQFHYLHALVQQKWGETEAANNAVTRAHQDYVQVDDKAGIGKVRSFQAQAAIDAMDYEYAQDLLEQNIQLWQATGNLRQMAVEQYQLGVMLSNRTLYSESDVFLQDACESFRKLADRRYEAYSLQILSANAMERDNLDGALSYIENAHTLFQAVNDQRGVAGALNYMGRIHNKHNDHARAIDVHQRAADVAQAIDYRFALTDAHRSMCEIHLKTGDLAAACRAIYTAVTVGETSGNRLLMLAVLAMAVGVLVADKRPSVAVDVACTIQATTDETLILDMLNPHITALDVTTGTPLTVENATKVIKKLYQ